MTIDGGIRSAWRKGGVTMTLEGYHRKPAREVPAPIRGSRLTERVPNPAGWLDRARCKIEGKPTSFFFPPEKANYFHKIREFCAGCEVRAECERDAVDSNMWFGWWGGKSPRERGSQPGGRPPRQHGKMSMYEFGPFGEDRSKGCRCDLCVERARLRFRKWEQTRRRAVS